MRLDIYVKKDNNRKTNSVSGYGDGYLGTPNQYYLYTSGFNPNDYDVRIGSVIKNETTGASTTISSIENSLYILLEAQIITSITDNYSVIVSSGLEDEVFDKLDQYDDEPVEITETIKDFKDVSKIFSDYSQQFKVPASKNNNRIFENYYNNDIIDGFDARLRRKCILKLNGIDWKNGGIRLSTVDMAGGVPKSYSITFFGETSSLKTLLGDDTLDSLPYLDAFDHVISLTEVRDFFSLGAKLDYDIDGYPTGYTMNDYPPGLLEPVQLGLGDIIYSFISADNRYFVDTNNGTPDISGNRNLFVPSGQEDAFHGLLYTDLKPSIKIIHFIRAIEFKYGIKFSDDFISENNIFFQTVYMQCGAESGSLAKLVEEDSAEFKTIDLIYSSGTELRQGADLDYFLIKRERRLKGGKSVYYKILYETEVDVTGSGSYTVILYDSETNKEYYREDVLSGNHLFSYEFKTYIDSERIKPSVQVVTSGGITEFQLLNTEVSSAYEDSKGDTIVQDTCEYTTTRIIVSQGIGFRQNLAPRMKCIDFIKDLFKLCNLIGYIEDGEIKVMPLNEYYDNGETFDVSEYVDYSSYTISRSDIFSKIDYKFNDPKSVFAIKSNELSRDEFGNESFSTNETTSFDGGTYDVSVKFGKMIYEKLFDVPNGDYAGGRWGYSVTESYSPTVEPNLLHSVKMDAFWAKNKSGGQNNYKYKLTDGTTYLSDLNPYQNIYHGARNFFEDSYYDTGTFSLNFGDEAYNNQDINDNTLFKRYHERYITSIYSESTRRLVLDAYLPIRLLLDIKTNSLLIINDNRYRVNSIKNNLATGKSKLELLSV